MTEVPKRIWSWPHFDSWITGQWSANTYHDDRTVEYILKAEHDRIVAEKDAEIARLRENMRDNYDAFCSMRNDLNEMFGDMVSSEATLADGPTMWAECAAVVIAMQKVRAALENRDE